MNNLFCAAGSKKSSVVVALDLTAAFDTISHSHLLARLSSHFGLTDCVLGWVESYLSERTQYVKVGEEISEVTRVHSGVPQGLVLGPLLFTLYISPVERLINSFGSKHQQYADDNTLYTILDLSNPSSIDNLQACTQAVNIWFLANNMQLNPNKTEAIPVGTRQQLDKALASSIKVAGADVQLADRLKLLGATVDRQMFNLLID